MYLPFLRGLPFELQAINELFMYSVIDGKKILPIIEPVKLKGNKAPGYKSLVTKQIPFIFITNPESEDLTQQIISDQFLNGVLSGYQNFIPGFIIHQQTDFKSLEQFIAKFQNRKIALIHNSMPAYLDKFVELINGLQSTFFNIFFLKNFTNTYTSKFSNTNSFKVILEDGFNKAIRNADYQSAPEFFSGRHNNFKEAGYEGFSDFCTIGEKYEFGGGGAHAVAIHWTYLEKENNDFMIRHFVSDDRTGTEDRGGKFAQAYKHLANFASTKADFQETRGWKSIEEIGTEGKNPHLGRIKKFSIMNHIELIKGSF